MTTQGLLSGKTVWIVFAAYFLFLIAIARYTTWKEKRDAGKVDLQGGRFKWPVMVMTYIASCMSVWVFFAGPGAYYRYGLGYFFSEMCIYSMFPIICYFTMTKVWLVNQQKHFTTPADFFFCRYKSKALTVIIDIVYIICAVPFISAVLVAGGRAAEVATGGAVSSQTFTLICGIIMTVFVMLGGVKSTALADAVQGWFFILALWAIIFRNAQDRIQRLDHRGIPDRPRADTGLVLLSGSDRHMHLSVARQLSACVCVRLHAAAAASVCALRLLQRGSEGPASDGVPCTVPADHRLGRHDAHRSGRAGCHA